MTHRWVNVKEVFEAETGTRVAKSENYLLQVEPSIQSARVIICYFVRRRVLRDTLIIAVPKIAFTFQSKC